MLGRIGFIGLGSMGAPMASNLIASGFSVICYDIAGTSERAPQGAEIATSVTQIAQSADLVVISVNTQLAVQDVTEEIARSEAAKVSIVMDTSTIGPNISRTVNDCLRKVNISFIDSPVAGGSGKTGVGHAAAKAAALTFIVSGPDAAVKQARPLMESMGRKIFHVGNEPGQAQAVKLINNFVFTSALISVSEAINYGITQNLDMGAILDVLNVSSGQNVATSYIFPELVEPEIYKVGATIEILAKDLAVYASEVDKQGSPNSLGKLVSNICNRMENSMPGTDWSQMYLFIRDGDGN